MIFNIEHLTRSKWLQTINKIHLETSTVCPTESVHIYLDTHINPKDLTTWHIVSLACLINFIHKKFNNVWLYANESTLEFFTNNLQLHKYFKNAPHIEATSKNILNLWQIIPEEAFHYSDRLSKYLKSEYFKGLDISMLKTMLDELYANVADHAKAEGNAYSYIKYNEESQNISVAFCDFGIGIPTCLKTANQHPKNHLNYIEYATKRGISAHSNSHNAGYGLSTVLECMEGSNHFLRVISNDEIYYHSNLNGNIIEKTYKLNFTFAGTLISYTIDISQFEKEEILGIVDLFNDTDW